MAKPIEEAVEEIVTGLLENTGMELVTVEYVRERDWYRRVFIDKEGGVDLDDCQDIKDLLLKMLYLEYMIQINIQKIIHCLIFIL